LYKFLLPAAYAYCQLNQVDTRSSSSAGFFGYTLMRQSGMTNRRDQCACRKRLARMAKLEIGQ